MPQGLTSSASQWCFFLILQPLLGHRQWGKTGECQLKGTGGGGTKACEGVGDPGHMVVPTWGPGLPGAGGVGELAAGGAEWPGWGLGVAAAVLTQQE